VKLRLDQDKVSVYVSGQKIVEGLHQAKGNKDDKFREQMTPAIGHAIRTLDKQGRIQNRPTNLRLLERAICSKFCKENQSLVKNFDDFIIEYVKIYMEDDDDVNSNQSDGDDDVKTNQNKDDVKTNPKDSRSSSSSSSDDEVSIHGSQHSSSTSSSIHKKQPDIHMHANEPAPSLLSTSPLKKIHKKRRIVKPSSSSDDKSSSSSDDTSSFTFDNDTSSHVKKGPRIKRSKTVDKSMLTEEMANDFIVKLDTIIKDIGGVASTPQDITLMKHVATMKSARMKAVVELIFEGSCVSV
jgi:hypothetical protein